MCPVTHLNWKGLSPACLGCLFIHPALARRSSFPLDHYSLALFLSGYLLSDKKTVAGNVVKLLYRADAIFIQLYLNIHTCIPFIVVIVVEGVQNSVGIFI